MCVMCMLRGNSDRIIRDGYHPNAYKMVKAIYPKRQRYKSLHLFGHSKPALRIFLIFWAAFQIFPENLRLRSNAVFRRHELDLTTV